MSAPVIVVDGVSKVYALGERLPYKSLRESLASASARLLGRASPAPRAIVRALDDIHLEVAAGEILGVIGRNGAGKTTLLKVVSRITWPSAGRVEIAGRVGSLLEVGTGFHPELTGRENVYLNGAILGMRRAEIDARFDEIVAFSEVERFIDTPVKRYSSGMYLRLAFSVAAHLYPDILLVDEVLAVGDIEFQKKCLGKMGDVGSHGRTVLLVSHNLSAIKSLCSRAVWIDQGRVCADGSAAEVVDRYLQSAISDRRELSWHDPSEAPGSAKLRLRHVAVAAADTKDPTAVLTMVTPLDIEVEFWALVGGCRLGLSLHLVNAHGVTVFNTTSIEDRDWHGRPLPAGRFRTRCRIPGRLLNSGLHSVTLLVVEDEGVVLSRHPEILSFEVVDSPELRSRWYGRWEGAVHPVLEWTTERIEDG